MSIRVIGGTFLILASLLSPVSASSTVEPNVDRMGGDYKRLEFNMSETKCKQACIDESPQCKAWTFVRAGVQGANSACWLKNAVPAPVDDDCCVSGVISTPSSGGVGGGGGGGNTLEPGIDRMGSDIESITSNTSVTRCRKACMDRADCMAWTYVKPGFQGPTAVCWLKHSVPAPKQDDCCTSGVK